MAHLYLESWPLEKIAPLCPAITLSRAMDDSASRRAGRRARLPGSHPAWQALIARVIEGYVSLVPGEPKPQLLLS